MTVSPADQLQEIPRVTSIDHTSSREALVEVTNLTIDYGTHRAVDHLTFSVEQGEFFTLLGPSGCGKSTTLMALAGFEQPTSGSIKLAGTDVTRTPPERRDMGVVFQNYALFPHLSVLANVMFPLTVRGVDRASAKEAAQEFLDLVEIPSARHPFQPTQLSGGQQQRVALARAMVSRPQVLLMDEPLSALDRRLRQVLQFELRSLRSRLDTTVLYVTHDQEEALVLSDRVAVMTAGRFEQVAGPAEVYNEPATPFVGEFLGSSNTLPVTVSTFDEDAVVVELGESLPPARILRSRCSATSGSLSAGHDPVSRILFLRPESVGIVADESDPDRDSVVADVRDVVFMGNHWRVEVELAGGFVWSLATSDDPPLAGACIQLDWDWRCARLFDRP